MMAAVFVGKKSVGETSLRKEKRRKFWGQQLRNKERKKDELVVEEVDPVPKRTKLRKDGKGAVKANRDGRKGRKLGRDGRKLGRDGRKLGRDGRKGGVNRDGRGSGKNRGFKSCQDDTSAIGSTETVTRFPTIPVHVEEGGEELLDSDTESESSVEHVTSTNSIKESSDDARTLQQKRRRRYILFMGNLPQTSTREEIMTHFERRGAHNSEFRLLSHKDTGKSKGCGFMEFGSDKAMRNALKFHRTRVLGKRINVEVTCGGGGKSEQRKAKITEKNRTLRKNKAVARPFKPKPKAC